MIRRLSCASIVVVVIALTSVPLCSSRLLSADRPLREQVDEQANPYITEDVVIGMTVGVYRDGRPHVFGYGTTRESDATVPDGKTVYEIGSISKVFTGVLLADAVNHQLLRLDQPVQGLLPKGVTMPSKGDKPILVRHLATHTSGLPRLPDNMKPANAENPYADYSQEQLFQFLSQHKLARAPGETSEYSNYAAGLLGQLLANRTNRSYDQLLQQRISSPLAMSDTVVELSDSQRMRLALPYDGAGTATNNWDFQAMVGAGGIRSTVDDMLKFAAACIDPPEGDIGKAIELAWNVHQPAMQKDDFAMGLGWHVARDGATRWHNGQTGGYHSMMLVNRGLKSAVVVLSNTASMEVDRLAEDVMRMMAGASVPPRTFEKVAKVSPQVMQRYVGRYQLTPQFSLTVSVAGDKLMIGATGQPTFEVFPRSDTEWFYKVVEATITFKLDNGGKCRELVLFQNGIHQTAKRVQ